MDKKFKILRFIGTVYKILGIVSATLTVLGGLGICLTSVLGGALFERFQSGLGPMGPRALTNGPVAGVIAALIVLLYGAITALVFYGIGEGVFLLLALEENTRATAAYLRKISRPRETAEPAPARQEE
ncbi:MAG: hypothetical protein JXC32_11405 [Anaerolineae bacterium]|nr:hypothetical protein [Anaerolineae bacterium]